MIADAIKSLFFLPAAFAAGRYAENHAIMGREFDRFGRQLGKAMLSKGKYWGARFLLHPVSSTRYWEFPFVLSCLPDKPARCLDVSSPNLFSFFCARNGRVGSIEYINPDERDVYGTQRVVDRYGLPHFHVEKAYVQEYLAKNPMPYDAIWSISVVEHISGDYDDTQAMRDMYGAVAPGGRLIVTVPTDKKAWDEYRTQNEYGLNATQVENRYFFQRFYTEQTIRERLIAPIGREPARLVWYGEKKANHFHTYIKEWQEQGLKRVIQDAREFSSQYQEYPSWDAMPGVGVCGLMFEKPR